MLKSAVLDTRVKAKFQSSPVRPHLGPCYQVPGFLVPTNLDLEFESQIRTDMNKKS